MARHPLLPLALLGSLTASVSGCACQCGNTITIRSDGGSGAGGGSTGGGATGGGGGGATGGGATGGGTVDGGDGTTTVGIGPGMFTLDGGAGGQGDGVKLDPNGHVVLNQGSAQFHFMWIANDAQGWVSKYDTRTGKEVGRYFSVIPKDCANSAGPPCAGGNVHGLRADSTYHPSRTAIDLYGDMFVANRGIGRQGSVTKIANDPSSCIDRNGNGTIETSRDLNNDGQISTNAADGEMIFPSDLANPATYDECVLFTKPLGGVPPGGEVAGRALAISAGVEGTAGDVWAGIYFEQRMYKLNSANGELVPVVAGGNPYVQISFGPYGAIVDRLQRLWVVEPGAAHLALIDATAGTLVTDQISRTNECAAYGIGIDGKNRVWLPGWTKGAIACRYDHSTGTWTLFDFSAARSQTGSAFTWGRGIAVDANGRVYMSGYGSAASQLIRFDSETGAVVPYPGGAFIDMSDGNTSGSVGVGLDADGNPWVNNYSGNASKIDNATGAITRTAQQPGGLYTYSDFTGYQLRNFTAPRGTYRKDFTACGPDNDWKELTWDAAVPPNTSLQVFVKAANTLADLANTGLVRYGPFTTSPVDLLVAGVPRTQYLRVEFVLRSVDGQSTPVLRSFNVKWLCGGIN
jgi:streptogramin lyase